MVATGILQQFPLFSHLSPALLAELAPHMPLRRYHGGQVIFHQGDTGTSLHIIHTGRVKIVVLAEEGQELLVTLLETGDFFGELALLDGNPRSASAVALTDTETYTLDRSDFHAFLRGSPDAAIALCVAVGERLRTVDHRLAECAFLDLPHRLGRQLLYLAQRYGRETAEGVLLDLPLSQRELAGLIGASRQGVNKALSQWEAEDVLRRTGHTLLLLRPERLREP
ncbi:MAG: Crp/Fnr family transcriptional regulator [Chloroflexi bacterium]|nr:Crp/Fnr family transcriptional regulator [Chloroflexota bacterium]